MEIYVYNLISITINNINIFVASGYKFITKLRNKSSRNGYGFDWVGQKSLAQ